MGKKEVHFYDDSFERGKSWYRAFYPVTRRRPVIDASPAYLCTPGTAQRAKQVAPDARVIALLRHPLERAASHCAYRRAKDAEPETSLAAAIADEPNRMASARAMRACYRVHSAYEVGLEAWMSAFPPTQLLVVISEEMFEGGAELDRIHEFIALPRTVPFPRVNATSGGWELSAEDRELAPLFAPTIEATERLLGRSTGWT
jgi:hypothetical protein